MEWINKILGTMPLEALNVQISEVLFHSLLMSESGHVILYSILSTYFLLQPRKSPVRIPVETVPFI